MNRREFLGLGVVLAGVGVRLQPDFTITHDLDPSQVVTRVCACAVDVTWLGEGPSPYVLADSQFAHRFPVTTRGTGHIDERRVRS